MSNLMKYDDTITKLAKETTVPALVAQSIPQEDWDAMPPEERMGAITFFLEEAARTTDGLKITFPRIKYPTSGAGVFEIPSPKGEPEYKSTFVGVVVAKKSVRAWWPMDSPIANNPPHCFSDDAITPNASSESRQAARCDQCPQSQFGSGKPGAGGEARGQACKQRINVFILRDVGGVLDEIPTVFAVPPSQIKAFSEFAVQVRKIGNFLSQRVVFGLTDTKSKDGTSFKGLTLKLDKKLTYKEMQQARSIADAFRDQMERRGLVADDDAAVIDAKHEETPF